MPLQSSAVLAHAAQFGIVPALPAISTPSKKGDAPVRCVPVPPGSARSAASNLRVPSGGSHSSIRVQSAGRPGTGVPQTQLVMNILRNSASYRAESVKSDGLVAETLRSLNTAGSDKMSSWPLLTTPRGTTAGEASEAGHSPRHHLFTGPLHQTLMKELVSLRLAHRRALECQDQDGDVVVLRRCARLLHTLRRGTLSRPDTAEVGRVLVMSESDSDTNSSSPLTHRSCPAPASPRQPMAERIRSSNVSTLLQTFLTEILPATVAKEWSLFESVTLPSKLEGDIAGSIGEATAHLEAVDAATYERLETELATLRKAEEEWDSQREANQKELDDLLASAENSGETLQALDRRFQILFDRHKQEHIQSQEAKHRIELVDQLRRNEKTLRSEIIQMTANLESVKERKKNVINEKTAVLNAVLEREEDIKEETRGLLSEKQWLAERHLSITMRQREEEQRTASIEAEISELQEKMKRRSEDIPIGGHLTPRPQWADRLDLVSAYRLPPPKVTLEANQSTDNTDEMPAEEDMLLRSRHGSRRDTVNPSNSLRRATLALTAASMFGRKRTGGASMNMSVLNKGMSFLAATRGPGDATGNASASCASFREMILRIRERLSVQTELLRLAQDHIKNIKETSAAQLDLVGNVCALNVANAGPNLPKQAATAVQPIGPSGALLPQATWQPIETSQRCIALWSAVLDGVVSKGDVTLSHHEETAPQALLQLITRRGASNSASQRAALALHARGGGGTPQRSRASGVLPEPAPFPAGRESASSSSGSSVSVSPGRGSRTATVNHSTAGAIPFGKAVNEELQLAQLLHLLSRQLEAYVAHAALFSPTIDLNSGSTGAHPRRVSVAPVGPGGKVAKRGGNASSRLLGDALRAIHDLGCDPDTQLPLSRVAVVTALALFSFTIPIRMLEDVAVFFQTIESSAVEISLREAASDKVPPAVSAHPCTDRIEVHAFVTCVKNACSLFGFGAVAVSELEAIVFRASVGGIVPLGFGGEVLQEGPLGPTTTPAVVDSASPSRQHHGSPMSAASPRKGSSVVWRPRQLHDPRSLTSASWSSVVALGDGGRQAASPDRHKPDAMGSYSSPSSPTKPSLRGRVAPLSASQLAETQNQTLPDSASPSSSPAAAVAPYRYLFTISARWSAFLDSVMKQHQLQQHQLLYWVAKVLVENCFPSESSPGGLFVVPARVLEVKLPLNYWNVDDPMFPDIMAMMDYYHKYPMPMAKEERRRSNNSAMQSPRRGGRKDAEAMDGSTWRLNVPRLMETIIHACDASAGAEHFGVGAKSRRKSSSFESTDGLGFSMESSTNSNSWGDSPKAGAAPGLRGSTGSTATPSPRGADAHRGSKGSNAPIIQFIQEPTIPPPTTPLGVYLRHVHKLSGSGGGQRSSAGGESYIWRPPSQRPAIADDFYDVEEVYQHLSLVPLRQYMYQ